MKSFLKALYKALHRPSVACLLISFLVLGIVLGVRAAGWLQRAELTIYDRFVLKRSEPTLQDDRIVIVGMTDTDLKTYGFPLDDARMAALLEMLDAQEPSVICLDMYRDLPEPRDRSLYPQLEAALKKLDRVIALERVGYVPPPPSLADNPDRVAANNLEKDFSIDGYYRRGPLFVTKDPDAAEKESHSSLSLAVVQYYLSERGGELAYVDGGINGPLLKLGKTVFPWLTPDAGGYVGLKVDDYQYLVDFIGPRRHRVQDEKRGQLAANTPYDYSFDDVFQKRLPAGALKRKIVFVATVMQSIKDSNPTPIDDNLRGVQQHVMMVHQLLEAATKGVPPMGWWPEWMEVSWIAFCDAAWRGAWSMASFAMEARSRAGDAAGLHRLFWLADVSTSRVGPGRRARTRIVCRGDLRHVIHRISREIGKRGDADHLFQARLINGRRCAVGAARSILDGGRLKPERVIATVLFTDLKGFSTTSEKMDPATLMLWMNEYMNDIARHVDEHGGMINKFIGDAIMAVFGVPVFHTVRMTSTGMRPTR
jgi:adenylate cyclase